MNKLILILVLTISFNLFAIEYNTYKMEVEYKFKAFDKNEREFEYLAVNNNPGSGSLSQGPAIFFIDNKLVFADQASHNLRTIILDNNYNTYREYNNSFYNMVVTQFQDIYIGHNPSYIQGFDISQEWKETFRISTYDLELFNSYSDLYYQDNTLFIFDKNNKLWGIKNPSIDSVQNRKNIIEEVVLINKINNGDYKGLSIDKEKRLFFDNELQTVNFYTFINYFKEIQNERLLSQPIVDFSLTIEDITTGSESFLGEDMYGNTYWTSWNTDIAVINNEGFMIDLFVADSIYPSTYPAVSPEGDVYFLEYGEDSVTLYKVERQW